MFQIRIHGRGGQGAVSAAQIISVAAFYQDNHSTAFPSFGSERAGAPVTAFVRIDDREIELREPVMDPDFLIVQDATLFRGVDVFSGLKPDGWVLINSTRSAEELGVGDAVRQLPEGHVVSLPASELAMKHIRKPKPNIVLMGGFAAMTGLLTQESMEKAIMEKFPGALGEANVKAARAAYDAILEKA